MNEQMARDSEVPTIAVAVDQLPTADQLRLGSFRVAAAMLGAPPAPEFFVGLKEHGLLDGLASLAREASSASLPHWEAFAEWLASADEAALEEARRDFLRVFVSAKHLPAPPWESVYLSESRLVLQEPARKVLLAYAEAGVGFDGMKETPADHVSLELSFAALLLEQQVTTPEAGDRLARFESQHLGRWLGRFCTDLAGAATSVPYLSLARALPLLVRVAPAH